MNASAHPAHNHGFQTHRLETMEVPTQQREEKGKELQSQMEQVQQKKTEGRNAGQNRGKSDAVRRCGIQIMIKIKGA